MKPSALILSVALALVFPAVVAADDLVVIVGFHGKADGGIFDRHGGRATTDLSGINAFAGRVPAGRLKALRAEPGVAYVEEDRVRQAIFTPNDYYYAGYQADDFGLINAPLAWDVSKGDGARVAVLDTGCQTAHPDLSGKVKVSRNFTSARTTDVSDKDGHGTHTAGTVGAKTDNKAGKFNGGVASAGFNCELAIGKVLGPQGGYDSWVAAGINWSWQAAGAKVVNMSLGAGGFSQALEDAVNAAWANGVVVVAAAGNDAKDASDFYPAASPNCISVAATDNTGALASFSNFGSSVDIAAPGVSITSTYKGSVYANMSGTSMASPHVAGVAALVWASPYGTSNASVRRQLVGTATRPVTGTNAGTLEVLDAHAAVTVTFP